ncbi:hypothetical protein MBBWO_13750 [Methanobrevibacter woesei]|jgi:uncharacterized membrane protein YczE|uniref:Membrane protein YczE n=1 Tax=Methanobrevibacter woesei TaxID=190976 RepID=A0A2U1S5Z0_9EURY|nr:DUF6198 family protein [Methanobrevibacter woesei]MCC9261022.1 DUF6198 family protein [Methanobrevibacter woesei]PWB85061.1 hypothetical protein MBBWO_13750 [Methanobrevibacter woesei]
MIEFRRIFNYVFGLFLITLGVGLSIKSNLGSTPVSSIPYTLNVIWGIEIGVATVIFHTMLVITELILLRRAFKPKHFLQVPVGILFGFFTTISVNLVNLLPDTSNIILIVIMVLVSTFLVALGLFFYVPTNIVPLSVEGITQAIAIVSNQPFTKVKVFFDVSVVVLSFVLCFIFTGVIGGSVGIGTIFSAIFVGITLKYINKVVLHFTGLNADLKKM